VYDLRRRHDHRPRTITDLRATVTDQAPMSGPTVLAAGSSGFVQLVRGARTHRALDAKFVPTGPIPDATSHHTSWSSHIAWAVQRSDARLGQHIWELFVSPCFLGGAPLEIPPAHTSSEAAARTWLTVLSQAWLRMVDATSPATNADTASKARQDIARLTTPQE
jgi:hypothetical protein